MSARCPFDPLIVARRVRRDSAMTRVVRCREEVERQVANCARVQACLDQIEAERCSCRERLAMLAAKAASPVELGRADERSALLAVRVGETRAELMAAERVLESARNELSEAVSVFLRAEAKLDALQQRRQIWLRERMQRADLIDEAMAEDLVVHRVVNAR